MSGTNVNSPIEDEDEDEDGGGDEEGDRDGDESGDGSGDEGAGGDQSLTTRGQGVGEASVRGGGAGAGAKAEASRPKRPKKTVPLRRISPARGKAGRRGGTGGTGQPLKRSHWKYTSTVRMISRVSRLAVPKYLASEVDGAW